METLYRARAWFASGPSFVLFALLIAVTLTGLPKPVKPPPKPPIKITIAPPPATPPTPLPTVPEVAQVQQQVTEIPLPTPVIKQVQRPTPRPTPTPAPTVAPQPETPSAPAAAVATPAPPHPTAPNANVSDAYIAQIRTYLESIKHYPTSKEARLQRPRGEVEVWFVLDRGGGVKDAGVQTSSGSLILDGAALQLVRGASYPAIPGDAFTGESTHRFTVKLNYTMT